jgi:hypothetical protein
MAKSPVGMNSACDFGILEWVGEGKYIAKVAAHLPGPESKASASAKHGSEFFWRTGKRNAFLMPHMYRVDVRELRSTDFPITAALFSKGAAL